MSSVKKLAIRGTLWTVGGYGASQILRFGSNVILARLLFPKLFGLIALVYVFVSGLELFSDIGLSTSVVQNKRGDDPAFLNTAWTLQIVRSFGLWLCCLVIAWPISKFYNEPQLLWLIPVVGLNSVIEGFNSTSIFTLTRHLSVKQQAIFEFGGQFVATGVTIAWAFFDKSIWALVVGTSVSKVILLVWSHRLNPGEPNRFAWEKEATKQLISFGKWIFVSTALTFLATQSDRLTLAKLFPFELLGIYGFAYTLSDIPKQLTLAIGGKVIFPTYAKFAELPREEFRAKILKGRKLLLIPSALGLAVLVGFGDLVISVLYDDRYAAAAWMLPILALGIWPVILNSTIDGALFAIGNPRYIAYASFWSGLFLIGGILMGYKLLGPLGAVIAVPFSNVPPYFVIVYGLWRDKLGCIRQDLLATALFLALLAVFIGGRIAFGVQLPPFGVV
jgi:O-antigen/teichoic acid export membrane protein